MYDENHVLGNLRYQHFLLLVKARRMAIVECLRGLLPDLSVLFIGYAICNIASYQFLISTPEKHGLTCITPLYYLSLNVSIK